MRRRRRSTAVSGTTRRRTAIAHSGHATLYALDALHRRGTVVERRPDHLVQPLQQPAVANGRVYLGTYDGTMYCFGVEAGSRDEVAMRTPTCFVRLIGAAVLVSASTSCMRRDAAAPSGRRAASMPSAAAGCAPTSGSRRMLCRRARSRTSGRWRFDNASRQLNALTPPVLLDRLIGYRGFKSAGVRRRQQRSRVRGRHRSRAARTGRRC